MKKMKCSDGIAKVNDNDDSEKTNKRADKDQLVVPSTSKKVVKIHDQNKKKLQVLLEKLVLRHNWVEASGVASMLLKGTVNDKSPATTRYKYKDIMDILRKIRGETNKPIKLLPIFDLWVEKIGLRSKQELFAVHFELIQHFLQRGDLDNANHDTLWLTQQSEFHTEPFSNMVVGLTHYLLWYSTIPEDLQLRHSDESSVPMQCEGSDPPIQGHLDISVRNDKQLPGDHLGGCKLVEETNCLNYLPSCFYMETSEDNSLGKPLTNGHGTAASIFQVSGLPSWLLPIRVPGAEENLECFMDSHGKMINNEHYKGAIKYLKVALHSTPSVEEALLPLIQLLLIGDNVDEALHELRRFDHHSQTIVSLRIKASVLEHFYSSKYVELKTCFEFVLKMDPTCGHSLRKLMGMHRDGFYSPQELLEMIALHLDATYAESNIWKEFACCFLVLSRCEGDRTSTCLNRSEGIINKEQNSFCFNMIPDMLKDGISRKNWKLRCKWWLHRHFSEKTLKSELESGGDLELLAYKAASACHMYGPCIQYVVKASTHLKDRESSKLFSFLEMHIKNSAGFYFS